VADLLQAGAAWLSGQLQAAAGRPVVYRRGDSEASVTCTIGRSQFESQNQSGVIENWESRDYLLPAGDLPFGDPQRGDLVLEEVGGDVLTYEVSAPRGIPVVHYDAFRTMARVHSTLTESGVVLLTTEDNETLLTEAGEQLVA
jgi:hypothetical protein